ncbi:MAG: DUF87 domain-containing protein [Actinomycetota bacterium]
MTAESDDHLYLGTTEPGVSEAEHRYLDGTAIRYESADLTTHGVIVGMTGSGKTGLGMIMLEEALLDGIPTLIIDPKGDMGNLLLTFPDLAAEDFAPWVDAESDPTATADLWRSGLERSGIGPERIGALRERCDMTIYTPGSETGVPLNVIGSLAAPNPPADLDEAAWEEALHDEVDGLVSSLLGLIGVESDPLSGREHILLANIVDHYWSRSQALTIESLIENVMQPPFRKLGVMSLDTLFPPSDRTALAMKLNGLAASPAFAAWSEGVPLDIDSMLSQPDGGPRAAIVNIAHLSDDERQFVVTLILSKLVTWMRSQPGSTDLRALVYMDEVYGYCPPSAMPPSKKPILTILKQARAFGVGLVLSTQNPVDLDYKAISNAGTWMIGRLQTERDKARLLDGMRRSDGGSDVDVLDTTISELDKREFVLHSTRATPITFSTRWAMSYLPGPLSRGQIRDLTEATDSGRAADVAPPSSSPAPAPAEPVAELADDESTLAPSVAKGIPIRYVDRGAPWADEAGIDPTGTRLAAALAVRVNLLFDDTKADLRHEAEWEAIVRIDDGRIDPDDATLIDYDDRDFTDRAPERATYVLPEAEIDSSPLFTQAKGAFKDHVYREETVQLFANKTLKLYSRIGESEDDFRRRCERAADDLADDELDDLMRRQDRDLDKQRDLLAKIQLEIEQLEEQQADTERDNRLGMLMDGVEMLGGLFGGRRRRRSVAAAGRRVLSGRRSGNRLDQRIETKERKLSEEEEDLAEILEDYQARELEIVGEFNDKAQAIEAYEVGLEKADIAIDDIALVWLPVER